MPEHPSILILGYSEAAMYLRQPEAAHVSAIVAIHGQREYSVETSRATHALVLQFDDSEAPDETDLEQRARYGIRRREAAEIGVILNPPTEEHARSIIEFARRVGAINGVMLFQCLAGISRSPAAALLCLAEWTGAGHEHECVEHILKLRPAAQPHRDLVRFGDKILAREGRLLSALDSLCP
ncbi:MAG TPA: hypothetical protein VJZ71_17080 [Phycisphaerae bacterium]|nr:hypothetical protein [Phycisphaerae bacterium]